MYHHASNKIRLTYFLILCKQILWINQIIKDNDIKGEYKVDKNKPCKLISLSSYISKIVFSEKSLSVHMSVRLSRPRPRHVPVPVTSPQKVAETENFAMQSCQIHFKGCYCRRRRRRRRCRCCRRCCIAGRGEAKPRVNTT